MGFPQRAHASIDRDASKSRVGNASMKINAVRFAAGLGLIALGAPLPAAGQYFPPLIIVPPPAQDYSMPKPAPRPPPSKPRPPPDTPPQPKSTGHYEGRTYVPD